MRIPRLKPYQIVLEVLCLILLLGGIIFTAIKFPGLPEKIPNHFDAAGNIIDYSGKGSIWLLEGINIAIYVMTTVFIFVPAIVQNPNVTWKVNPGAKFILESETISLLGETKLECVLLFDYLNVMIIRGVSVIWPVWALLGIMTVGMVLRLIHMKKVSAMPK